MSVYKLSKNAILETFDDGGLVLILPERRLVELNPRTVEIVKLLDGQRTSEQVAVEISGRLGMQMVQANKVVIECCSDLYKSGILSLQSKEQEHEGMINSTEEKIICNPDVVLREEDPDEGALLFNPDTNQVKIINTTGLFIWQMCGEASTIGQIVAEVQKAFDEVPLEQVTQDVQEFVETMLASGFIGTVEK